MDTQENLKRAADLLGMPVQDYLKRKVELQHQHIALLADEIGRIRGEVDELVGMLNDQNPTS